MLHDIIGTKKKRLFLEIEKRTIFSKTAIFLDRIRLHNVNSAGPLEVWLS